MDAKNRKAEALATELHLTETSLSERQAEVALLKGHERDYLQKIATLEVSVKVKERKGKERKGKERKGKERKNYLFLCQSNEKPSIILGCPGVSTCLE